jgi:hypothetical protein
VRCNTYLISKCKALDIVGQFSAPLSGSTGCSLERQRRDSRAPDYTLDGLYWNQRDLCRACVSAFDELDVWKEKERGGGRGRWGGREKERDGERKKEGGEGGERKMGMLSGSLGGTFLHEFTALDVVF